MQESSWLTTVIGIGKEGHRLLHEVQSRMASEDGDATKDEGIELCHYWELPMDDNIEVKDLEHNCQNIAIAFLLVDVSDENNIRYAQEIGKFVSTQRPAVSIAILNGKDPVQIADVAAQLFSDVDAVIDLNKCMVTGGLASPYMAYNIVRGINGMLVKPGMIGLDAVDLTEQLRKTGLLHVGFGNVGTDHDEEAMATATKDALSQIKGANAKRIVLCLEGKSDVLSMIDIYSSAETVQKAMPSDALILLGATESKSTGNMVRALIVVSDL